MKQSYLDYALKHKFIITMIGLPIFSYFTLPIIITLIFSIVSLLMVLLNREIDKL